MIRSISPVATETASKAGLLGLRPTEGFGERASNDTVEQQSVAVRQAAVVALGTGVKTSGQSGTFAAATYTRPPPSSRSSRVSESTTAASALANGAGGADDANAASGANESPDPNAANAGAATENQLGSAEIAAGSFFALSAQPIKGDTEATLQKLLQMRDEALSPPASVADLAIATAAAMRISRLVRERYAAEQISGGKPAEPPAPSSRPTLPPAGVKA